MEQQVHVGKVSDSMEKLEKLCKEKAELMAKTMTDIVKVPFWTEEPAEELICVANFSKGEDGRMTYELDFSQSTL